MNKLIFDRTSEDLKNKNEKAFYNLNDYTRILSYLYILNTDFNLNINLPQVYLGKKLTNDEFCTILNNIDLLKEKSGMTDVLPPTPTTDLWDYEKANILEFIIFEIYIYVLKNKKTSLYSGTFVSGNHLKIRGIIS